VTGDLFRFEVIAATERRDEIMRRTTAKTGDVRIPLAGVPGWLAAILERVTPAFALDGCRHLAAFPLQPRYVIARTASEVSCFACADLVYEYAGAPTVCDRCGGSGGELLTPWWTPPGTVHMVELAVCARCAPELAAGR
jgi:hypothetical protein